MDPTGLTIEQTDKRIDDCKDYINNPDCAERVKLNQARVMEQLLVHRKTLTKKESNMKMGEAEIKITKRGDLWYHKVIGNGWVYTDNRGRTCWMMCKNNGINVATWLHSKVVKISKRPKGSN